MYVTELRHRVLIYLLSFEAAMRRCHKWPQETNLHNQFTFTRSLREVVYFSSMCWQEMSYQVFPDYVISTEFTQKDNLQVDRYLA